MGLDISLYKVVPLGNRKYTDVDNYYSLDDFPELKTFEHLSFEIIEDHYELINSLAEIGYDFNKLQYHGTVGNKKGITFEFKDSHHELFIVYTWLNTLLDLQENGELIDYRKEKDFFNSEYFKFFEKEYLPLMLKYGWKAKYKFKIPNTKKTYFSFIGVRRFIMPKIKVLLKNPPTIKKKVKCIAVENVSYQRKGANRLFYEHDIWDSPCITDLKTLELHSGMYFSQFTRCTLIEKTVQSYDEEYNEIIHANFKENILDKFVEGEMFVIYH